MRKKRQESKEIESANIGKGIREEAEKRDEIER